MSQVAASDVYSSACEPWGDWLIPWCAQRDAPKVMWKNQMSLWAKLILICAVFLQRASARKLFGIAVDKLVPLGYVTSKLQMWWKWLDPAVTARRDVDGVNRRGMFSCFIVPRNTPDNIPVCLLGRTFFGVLCRGIMQARFEGHNGNIYLVAIAASQVYSKNPKVGHCRRKKNVAQEQTC